MKTISFFLASIAVRIALAISQRIQPRVISHGKKDKAS
jgi:hypothetical protein